jgi:hypothetical protein
MMSPRGVEEERTSAGVCWGRSGGEPSFRTALDDDWVPERAGDRFRGQGVLDRSAGHHRAVGKDEHMVEDLGQETGLSGVNERG